jgi:hypothetical protein
LQFNAMDSSGKACTYSVGEVMPLSSTCFNIEGSNLMEWFTLSNIASSGISPAGSLTINQWPAASGQSISVTFSEDAQLVLQGQPATSVPVAGSFVTTAM